MKTIFLILGSLILLGAGCSSAPFSSKIIPPNDNQQTTQEQQKKIDELTKKVETLSASLSSTSTVSQPIKIIVKEIPKKDNSEEVSKLKAQVKELENQPIQKLKVSETSKIDYSAFIPYVVKIVCPNKSGSGTVVLPNTIMTNYHVIQGNKECLIGFTDNAIKAPSEWFIGQVTAVKESIDSAMLAVITPLANKTIKICDASNIKIADNLVVLGYPSTGGDTMTITNGNISGFLKDYIKTSAKINPGNSGGAAIHESGCYLGIPTAYVKGQAESLGLITDYTGITDNADEYISPSSPNVEDGLTQEQKNQAELKQQALLEAQRREQEQLEAKKQQEKEKIKQLNALMAEYEQKKAEVDKQILDLTEQYYGVPNKIKQQTIDYVVSASQYNQMVITEQSKILNQINQLNLKKEQLRLEYLDKINSL